MKYLYLFLTTFAILWNTGSEAQVPDGFIIDSVIRTDPAQQIAMVSIPLRLFSEIVPDILIAEGTALTNSQFAERSDALVAINGSFFNTKTYEMVTYYENDNTVLSRNARSDGPSLFNGIIIIDRDDNLRLQPFQQEEAYEISLMEKEALVSGPMLLEGGNRSVLPERPAFVNKRHPRSCLCTTEEALILVAVDGRRDTASGMTLPELQEFLLEAGCKDAINLDGGGSTSLWVKGMGVINTPSDTTGERAVVNVLVILPKTKD
ncbi:phosphodiester glycosidase family protein [Robertkochia flava]|uniref:phosphodiester glycosidase family protein n=1 Tax=Robertkochia flava TaxID=3447986 RepID=UPI001CCA9892|nr:phosphodiester glycosidase family protein [Robertkochia marina]